MINTVTLVGRLGADPEGFPYGDKEGAKFRLAVNRPAKEDVTDWFDVTCFEPTSRFVLDYMRKGALVGIEGRLQSRTWEREGGGRGYAVEVLAHRVQGLESRADREAREGSAPAPARQQKPKPQAAPDWEVGEEADPFADQT